MIYVKNKGETVASIVLMSLLVNKIARGSHSLTSDSEVKAPRKHLLYKQEEP